MTAPGRHCATIAAAIGVTTVLVLGSGLGSASASETWAQDPVAALASAYPAALADTGDSVVSAAQSPLQAFDTSGTLALVLDVDSASSMTIAAPLRGTASRYPATPDGVIAYDNGDRTSTVAVTHTDGSVAFNSVMWDRSAATEFSYSVGMANGSSLHQNANGRRRTRSERSRLG